MNTYPNIIFRTGTLLHEAMDLLVQKTDVSEVTIPSVVAALLLVTDNNYQRGLAAAHFAKLAVDGSIKISPENFILTQEEMELNPIEAFNLLESCTKFKDHIKIDIPADFQAFAALGYALIRYEEDLAAQVTGEDAGADCNACDDTSCSCNPAYTGA